eukprot:scaffold3779_cov254-Ochromonas_danica.AAC.32
MGRGTRPAVPELGERSSLSHHRRRENRWCQSSVKLGGADSFCNVQNMHKKKATNKARYLYIYALGVCVMCGRQTFQWHIGFGQFDAYLYGLAVLVYVVAFTMLTFSFVELISIVPFSGGCYGYSRCALGPAMGYMAGMFETAKYILYATFNVRRLGDIFQEIYGFEEKYEIMIWLAFLVAFNLVHHFQTRMLWWTVALVGVAIFVTQVMFIMGSTSAGTMTNLTTSHWDENPADFVKALPYATYMLSALDAVRTCVDNQGGDIVPRALLHVLAWSTVAGLASIVAQAAYIRDDKSLINEHYAYSVGMRMALNLSAGDKFVTLFALPGSLGCCLGFLYCAARQVRSMASSGLLPSFLAMEQGQKVRDSSQPVAQATSVVPGDGTEGREGSTQRGGGKQDFSHGSKPTMAVFASSVLCFSLLLVGHFLITDYWDIYTQMGQLLNSSMYQFLMISYVVFSTRFSNMERGIRSPFGIPGAVLAMAFFMLLFVVRLYYNPKTNTGYGITLVVFTVSIFIYYVVVVQHRQFFSKEEQEKFMKAYVVNANKTRKRGKSGSNSRQSGKSTSVLGMLAGAVMFFQPNASRGVSNRSGSRGSSMSGQIKASTSGNNLNVTRNNNAVVPA